MNDFDFLGDAFSDFKDFIEEKPVSNQEIPMIYLVEDDKLLSQSIVIYLSKKLGLKVKAFEGPGDFLAHLATLDEVDQGEDGYSAYMELPISQQEDNSQIPTIQRSLSLLMQIPEKTEAIYALTNQITEALKKSE